MTKQRQTVIILLFVLLALTTVTMFILYTLVWERNDRRVTALGKNDATTFTVNDFRKSSFHFFETGTFDIQIIYSANDENTVFFIGIGKYEKNGNKYNLFFEDAYGLTNIGEQTSSFVSVKSIMNANPVYETKGNQISFIDHNGQIYYFK
jgi:hypothetical protein